MFKFILQFVVMLMLSIVFAVFIGEKLVPITTESVSNSYMEYAETAHITLIKQTLEDIPKDERVDYINSLPGKIGHNLALVPLSSLSEKIQKKLNEQTNLPITTDYENTGISKDDAERGVFASRLADDDKVILIYYSDVENLEHLDGAEKTIFSVIYFLEIQLAKLPADKVDAYIKTIFTDNGPKVSIINGDNLPKNLKQQRLPNGRVIYKTSPENLIVDEKFSDFYYIKINHPYLQNQYFKAGPLIEDRQTMYAKVFGIAAILFLLLTMLPMILWLAPSWVSLRRIMLATHTFSKGELNSRAKPLFGSHLNQLTKQYNSMADNIQRLFDSHKMMTMAVSHDLRTPLSRLEFAMEMMRSSPENAHKQLDRMQTAVDDLSKLVSEVLMHATLDRDNEAFEFERFDGKTWLNGEMEQWQFNNPNLSIQWHYSGNKMLEANSYYLSRALLNLMSNACKFAQTCVCVNLVSHDDNYTLVVEDDGKGVPEEFIDKIFYPFEKLDSSRNLQAGGTGLGLAIVKLVAERHNGTVTVQNKKGTDNETGALFTFTWNK